MAHFELEWSMYGRAVIEADDQDEAEEIMHTNLFNLDSAMFDEIDVDGVDTVSVEQLAELEESGG